MATRNFFLSGFIEPSSVPQLEAVLNALKPQLQSNSDPIEFPRLAGSASLGNYTTLVPGTERWVQVDSITDPNPTEFRQSLKRHLEAFDSRFRERAGFQFQNYLLFAPVNQNSPLLTIAREEERTEAPLFLFSTLPGTESLNAAEADRLKTFMLAQQSAADKARILLDQETTRLRNLLAERTAELQECRNTFSRTSASGPQTAQLEQQLAVGAAEIKSLSGRANLAESQLARVRTEADTQLRQARAKASEVLQQALQACRENGEQTIEELNAEIRQLQRQLEANSRQEQAQVQQVSVEYESRIQAAVKDFQTLNEQLANANQRSAELAQQLETTQSQLATATEQLNQLNSEKIEAIQYFSNLNSQLSGQDQELVALQQRLNSVITSGQEETGRLQSQLANYQVTQEQVTVLAEANAGLREDMSQLLNTNRQLGSNCQKLTARIQELELENATGLRSELAAAQAELTQQKSANQALANLQSLNTKKAESASQQLTSLLKEKQDLLKRNALLLDRQDCSKAPEFLQLQEEASSLQQRLSAQVESYSELEERLQAVLNENSTLSQSIQPLQARLGELTLAQQPSTGADMDQLRADLSATKQQLSLANENVKDYGEEIDRLSALVKQQITAPPAVVQQVESNQLQECILRGLEDRKEIERLQSALGRSEKRIEEIALDSNHLVEQHKYNLEECARRANFSEESKQKFRQQILDECGASWAARLEEANEEHEATLQSFKTEAAKVFGSLQQELNSCINK